MCFLVSLYEEIRGVTFFYRFLECPLGKSRTVVDGQFTTIIRIMIPPSKADDSFDIS